MNEYINFLSTVTVSKRGNFFEYFAAVTPTFVFQVQHYSLQIALPLNRQDTAWCSHNFGERWTWPH